MLFSTISVESWSRWSREPSGNFRRKWFSTSARIASSCVANLDNILTVPRQRLKRLMGACDAGKLEELNLAIKAALDVH
jgi:mRNA-degrading endonuclease toxin of MazEF toxin-antitoxin module